MGGTVVTEEAEGICLSPLRLRADKAGGACSENLRRTFQGVWSPRDDGTSSLSGGKDEFARQTATGKPQKALPAQSLQLEKPKLGRKYGGA